MLLDGKTAVISGAASPRGIGLATARLFARHGARVAILVYMRLLRGHVPLVLDKYGYRFELGRAKLLRDGADVLVIAAGFMTMRTLEAAGRLRADGVEAAVLHSPTLKPLDAGTILREGVRPPAVRQVALPDASLAAGARPTLHDRYGPSTEAMTRSIKGWL